MSIENLFSKRRQIRAAWDQERIPSKELIHGLLTRTLNIAPSKQNLFPFKIHVIEPDNIEEHNAVAGICSLFASGSVNDWEKDVVKGIDQGNKKAPWALVFTLRLCEPNNFVVDHAKKNNVRPEDRFNQLHEEKFRHSVNTHLSAVEAGMFIEILTGLCIESDIHCSYIKSFPEWSWDHQMGDYQKDTNTVGFDWSKLPWVSELPIILVQLGYKANMPDSLASNITNPNVLYWENKPSIDTIVEYHPNKS